MKFLIHLGHPAHFHLFKNILKFLEEKGHKVFLVINGKDILEELLIREKINYYKILNSKKGKTYFEMIYRQIISIFKLLIFSYRHKINLFLGSTPLVSHVGFITRKPSFLFVEDDAEIVPLFAKITYPFATYIVTPNVCSVGKWFNKKIGVDSYHELAYLHPNHFTPSKSIAEKYIKTSNDFFIIRFSKLGAYHDKGISGISNDIAKKIILDLKKHGDVYITSERVIDAELEQYRISVNPVDIHHLMAFSSLFIGDSQTMAAEAAVLGVPFIRFNDFVGKISYLNELENHYKLGYGINTHNLDQLFKKVKELLNNNNKRNFLKLRKKKC